MWACPVSARLAPTSGQPNRYEYGRYGASESQAARSGISVWQKLNLLLTATPVLRADYPPSSFRWPDSKSPRRKIAAAGQGSHDQQLVVKMFHDGNPSGANAVPARTTLGPNWAEIAQKGSPSTCLP
jgi:hypothetical protein